MALTATTKRAVLFEAVQERDHQIEALMQRIEQLEVVKTKTEVVTPEQYQKDISRRGQVVVEEIRALVQWIRKDIETTKRWAEVSLPKFN